MRRNAAAHVAQQVRFAVQVADRQLALGRVLHFVQRVRALLNGDAFAIPHKLRQLCLLRLQICS